MPADSEHGRPDLDALLAGLRERLGASRCTLREADGAGGFPVVGESLGAGVASLRDDRSDLRGQPVVVALSGGAAQVVQPDVRAISDDPAFLALMRRYGVRAQVVSAVRASTGGRLLGLLSVHDAACRDWTPEECELAFAAAATIASVLDVQPMQARPGGHR
ncbi:hypothetical protein DSM104299_03651 [Baekduia alba]|uniref:GAF domain-containing protein n=1 Tax=Baekduia alba TaxID=2997333 RepID=UPI002340637A|nr:GAF domain-containing protein [Baekduia alba]WCB94911.1 hypothetical protein DSM104299_03651 [Baekduia alba]